VGFAQRGLEMVAFGATAPAFGVALCPMSKCPCPIINWEAFDYER